MSQITNPRMYIDAARQISGWCMRDVLDYLASHAADILEYPDDADTDLMGVCDRENRARAVVYKLGCSVQPCTLDAAGRALEHVAAYA